MVGIIITGHSNFATGIASAVKLVAGQQKNLEAVDFPDTYSTEELKTKLTEALDKLEECKNIIFFSLLTEYIFHRQSPCPLLVASAPHIRTVNC